jgi:hypothetical protein
VWTGGRGERYLGVDDERITKEAFGFYRPGACGRDDPEGEINSRGREGRQSSGGQRSAGRRFRRVEVRPSEQGFDVVDPCVLLRGGDTSGEECACEDRESEDGTHRR